MRTDIYITTRRATTEEEAKQHALKAEEVEQKALEGKVLWGYDTKAGTIKRVDPLFAMDATNIGIDSLLREDVKNKLENRIITYEEKTREDYKPEPATTTRTANRIAI